MSALLIQNFAQFIDALNLCDTGIYSYDEVFDSIVFNSDDLQEELAWDSQNVHQSVIVKERTYEVFIQCFEPGQATNTHNHNNMIERLSVVTGEIEIEKHNNDESVSESFSIQSGNRISIEEGTRRFINKSSERSISVHLLYSK